MITPADNYAQVKAWRALNKDKVAEQGKRYRARYTAKEAARQKAWRLKNLDRERAMGRERRALRQALVDEARSGGCVDCGERDPRVLESDHVRGKKSAGIARMVGERVSLDRLRAELEKCETRCANCHARVTWDRRHAEAA